MGSACILLVIQLAATAKVHAFFGAHHSDEHSKYDQLLERYQSDPAYKQQWDAHVDNYTKTYITPITPDDFPCAVTTPGRSPDSVHKLKPGDVRVIGALGDSLTAGNGIKAVTAAGSLRMYRGLSWTVGGEHSYEEGVTTLPNILKKYNPMLTGYAIGTGKQSSSNAKLNVAVPGSVASDLLAQAKLLIERMRSMEDIDFLLDWKVVSMFIGGNDLCALCKDEERYSPAKYVEHIREVLDLLKQEVPRVFINVVSMFDLTPVVNMSSGITCTVLHWSLCRCGMEKKYDALLKQTAMDYSRGLAQLIDSGRYDTTKDFTVVFQPFLRDNNIPLTPDGKPDFSYFAPDCFHFSQKGHNTVSTLLWNSMFEPVGKKSTHSNYDDKLYCPKSREYLATSGNSGNAAVRSRVAEDGSQGAGESVMPMAGVVGLVLFILALAGVVAVGLVVVRWRRSRNPEHTLLLVTA